jgi:pyruvate kinase
VKINRRTKIVATIGPASDSAEMIKTLIETGVDVFRLNFSHGLAEHHIMVAKCIREQSSILNRQVGILADLQGPKIRIGVFAENKVTLQKGAKFTLDLDCKEGEGDRNRIGLEYKALCDQVYPEDILLLDDGRIRLKVDKVNVNSVLTTVLVGGELSSRKGINRLGGGLAAAALTDKDRADIKSLAKLVPDFVAVSFVSSAEDIAITRALLAEQNLHPAIIAKIERAEVVADDAILTSIIQEAEGVMVARGDLGVEVGDAALIGIQKNLIKRARKMDRVVITATQMMESMISASMPTRAEVFDVANAVLDGTDAVMLSGETAVGQYPIEVVAAMSDTCLGAERHPTIRNSLHRVDRKFNSAQETIAMSAIYAANHYPAVRGIACLTESGTTPLLMSRLSSGLPIFALSYHSKTLRKLSLARGVIPLFFDFKACGENEINQEAINFLKKGGYLQVSDAILLTKGGAIGKQGGTDIMQILRVD